LTPNNATPVTHPAYFLTGINLPDDWTVLHQFTPAPSATGGNFSVGYEVENTDGHRGFLKALDLSSALAAPDLIAELNKLTDQYSYEVDLLEFCKTRRMDKIVTAIDKGTYRPVGVGIPVPYIIFDLADGDVRAHVSGRAFDLAWILRCLHHAVTATQQLHSNNYAHGDLKPSNVLVFGKTAKVADLGRATDSQQTSPFSHLLYCGDRTYAPPEALYEENPGDMWKHRRGCDLYQLGSFIAFLFAHRHINDFLKSELDPQFHPTFWNGPVQGNFMQTLPYIMDAFARALDRFAKQIRQTTPEPIAIEVIKAVQDLCSPDPMTRGHPRNRVGNQNAHGLERYVSLFDRLAISIEKNLITMPKTP
jgi:eukaryotic-like serine/threonine-protein kinase